MRVYKLLSICHEFASLESATVLKVATVCGYFAGWVEWLKCAHSLVSAFLSWEELFSCGAVRLLSKGVFSAGSAHNLAVSCSCSTFPYLSLMTYCNMNIVAHLIILHVSIIKIS